MCCHDSIVLQQRETALNSLEVDCLVDSGDAQSRRIGGRRGGKGGVNSKFGRQMSPSPCPQACAALQAEEAFSFGALPAWALGQLAADFRRNRQRDLHASYSTPSTYP